MTSPSPHPQPRGRDAGTTLIQLIVPIVVMTVLATALLSMVATFLRSGATTSQRLDESRDLQQIAVYLPSDVSSALLTELVRDTTPGDAYLDADDPTTPAPCPGYSGTGSNILNLKWSESFGSTTKQYRVGYRIETVGAETRIVRISCEGGSLGAAAVKVVARALDAAVPVAVQLNGAVVKVTFTEKTGQTQTLTASSKNPDGSLEYTNEFDE